MITLKENGFFRPAFLAAAALALALAAGGCDGGGRRASPSLVMTGQAGGGAKEAPAEGAAASADSTDAAAAPKSGARNPVEYRLGAGDQLQVSVFGQQDLSGKFEVDGDGNLILPLVGQIHAEGRTVGEVQDTLTNQLNKSFVVNPKVNVQVLNYRPFYILGEVNKPGSYPYVVGINVRQAVAIAGGYTRRARSNPVQVIHSGGSAESAVAATPDDPVLPGDTIQVDRRLF